MRVKTDKKTMLGIYVPLLRRVTKLKLEHLSLEVSFSSGVEKADFTVTVFDNNNDNLTFNFYSWKEVDAIKEDVKLFFTAVKAGSFFDIKKLKEKHDLN